MPRKFRSTTSAPRRLAHERPYELLIVDPSAPLERVVDVGGERVRLGQHGVVAALDHARASGASQEALHDEADAQRGGSICSVQGRAESGAAGAEEQHIDLEDVEIARGQHVSALKPSTTCR